MPHADPQARSEYQAEWRKRNREKLRTYARARQRQSYSKYTFPYTQSCAYCKQEFTLHERPTASGSISTYCSAECKRNYANDRGRFYHTRQKYGLDREAYERMLAEQDGVCACCGEEFRSTRDGKNPICVDHCHVTGRVRGLLCSGCNSAAGKIEKRGEMVTQYLARVSFDLRDWCVA